MYVSTIGVLRYPYNEKRVGCVVLYCIVCACVCMDGWMERSIAQSGMNERGCAVLCCMGQYGILLCERCIGCMALLVLLVEIGRPRVCCEF